MQLANGMDSIGDFNAFKLKFKHLDGVVVFDRSKAGKRHHLSIIIRSKTEVDEAVHILNKNVKGGITVNKVMNHEITTAFMRAPPTVECVYDESEMAFYILGALAGYHTIKNDILDRNNFIASYDFNSTPAHFRVVASTSDYDEVKARLEVLFDMHQIKIIVTDKPAEVYGPAPGPSTAWYAQPARGPHAKKKTRHSARYNSRGALKEMPRHTFRYRSPHTSVMTKTWVEWYGHDCYLMSRASIRKDRLCVCGCRNRWGRCRENIINRESWDEWDLSHYTHYEGYATAYTGDYPHPRNDDPYFLAEPSALMVD